MLDLVWQPQHPEAPRFWGEAAARGRARSRDALEVTEGGQRSKAWVVVRREKGRGRGQMASGPPLDTPSPE